MCVRTTAETLAYYQDKLDHVSDKSEEAYLSVVVRLLSSNVRAEGSGSEVEGSRTEAKREVLGGTAEGGGTLFSLLKGKEGLL